MYRFLKRSFDVFGSALGILLFLPVGIVVALLIKLSDGGPVFFSQTRVGQFGRPFRIWKFRSMVVNAEQKGVAVTSGTDRRITTIGRFLRRTKLDEVPQLWNVLIGEMSFVGPRPEVPRYVEHYTEQQRRVLDLRPGITDIASVAFRNEEEILRGTRDVETFYLRHCMPAKIEMNLAYARKASFVRDLWVLLQTLCPYWVGVLALYALTLTGSLGLTFLLLTDSHWSEERAQFYQQVLPWMVGPQLICLFWQGQARGLLSYFSIPELRRTAIALGLAFGMQFLLSRLRFESVPVPLNVLLTHLLMSFFAICGVRMGFRLVRERSTKRAAKDSRGPWRVAIIGLGETATNLALDLGRTRNPERKVVAFFDDDPANWQKRPHDIPVFGMPECLLNPEWHKKIDEVIITSPAEQPTRIAEIESMLRESPMRVTRVSTWPVLGR